MKIVWLCLCLVGLAGCSTQTTGGRNAVPTGTTLAPCDEAVALAEAQFPEWNEDPARYQLVEARTFITPAGEYRGPAYWHLSFKLRELIPATVSEELGAGGLLYVEVELDRHEARLVGYGE
jgi:hypothetical protein